MMRIIKISKKVQSSSTRILSTRESFRRGERKGREGHERREGGGWMDEWLDVADYRSCTLAGLVWPCLSLAGLGEMVVVVVRA